MVHLFVKDREIGSFPDDAPVHLALRPVRIGHTTRSRLHEILPKRSWLGCTCVFVAIEKTTSDPTKLLARSDTAFIHRPRNGTNPSTNVVPAVYCPVRS